jgi:hypothetical protein
VIGKAVADFEAVPLIQFWHANYCKNALLILFLALETLIPITDSKHS